MIGGKSVTDKKKKYIDTFKRMAGDPNHGYKWLMDIESLLKGYAGDFGSAAAV